jgi:UDP-N-acetylmuramoylalanine--D-glutamate ligase
MCGAMCRAAGLKTVVAGNIGLPVLDALREAERDGMPDVFVLELSSFQLETIECFSAQIGVCLNVTPDHLDRHHTFENYADAKARLFETQRADDFAVLNADDRTTASYGKRTQAEVVWFSFRAGGGRIVADDKAVSFDGKPFLAIADIPLRGRHNVENTMAAAGAARLAGVSLDAIAASVRTFPGVEHRIEFVRKLRGVDFYNDSKATNVDATMKAIDAFPGGLWIILGGKDKGSDYTVLRQPLREKAKAALLIGAAAPKIKAHLDDAVRLIEAGTIEDAVRAAWSEAVPGDTILLAPACASFDQFNSYEHRGQVFKELVRGLQ